MRTFSCKESMGFCWIEMIEFTSVSDIQFSDHYIKDGFYLEKHYLINFIEQWTLNIVKKDISKNPLKKMWFNVLMDFDVYVSALKTIKESKLCRHAKHCV